MIDVESIALVAAVGGAIWFVLRIVDVAEYLVHENPKVRGHAARIRQKSGRLVPRFGHKRRK